MVDEQGDSILGIYDVTSIRQDNAAREIFGIMYTSDLYDIYEAHARIAKFIPKDKYDVPTIIVKHEGTEYLIDPDGVITELNANAA